MTFSKESGLYYLQSRYYNSEVGRFINADVYAGTGHGLLGNNMFAYCNNSPIISRDPLGKSFQTIKLWPDEWEDLINIVDYIVCAFALLYSSHDANRRPNSGDPGSIFIAPNGDKRKYGQDGRPEWDYDHDDHGEPNKPRDKDGGHYHDWDWSNLKTPRGKAHEITGAAVLGYILVFFEYIAMYAY